MSIQPIEAQENIEVRCIIPPHEVQDEDKFSSIADSMRKNGWQGRPLLVIEAGDGFKALTGSHRLAAAVEAELETVPVVMVDAEKFFAEYDLSDLWDDEINVSILKEVGDTTAATLMEMELDKE